MPSVTPYVTYTIVGVTVLVYLLQLLTQQLGIVRTVNDVPLELLVAYGGKINNAIRAGELWRLITPVLLHASVPHIAFNMYALFAFGAGLERSFGHWRFLVLYVLGGFAGNVLSFLLSPGVSVGASTAVFGLVAAEGIFLYQNRALFGNQFRRAITNVIFVVAINLALGLTPGIDNWGHVGGLLGGLIFTLFAGPIWQVVQAPGSLEIRDKREMRDTITGAAVVVIVFGALAIWGMLAPFTK
ncbi:MAG: rhomboid family intramembrane serine protease [Anaerolineae bacterium]